jgi:hypothetical protein
MIKNGIMEGNMKKFLFPLIFAVFVCASCATTIGPHGASVAIAPPLPVVVELVDPYYLYSGYHYYYHNDRWYYSKTKTGRWKDLPRDRYPKEVRFKGKKGERDRRDDRGRDHGKRMERW